MLSSHRSDFTSNDPQPQSMTLPDSLLTSSDHFNGLDCFKNIYQSHLSAKGLRSDSPMKEGPSSGPSLWYRLGTSSTET